MTTLMTLICRVCSAKGINKDADFWCPKCDSMCSECKSVHECVKSTKRHHVIPIEEFRQILNSVISSDKYCQAHSKENKWYCKQHEAVCCRTCVSNDHKNCSNTLRTDSIIETHHASIILHRRYKRLEKVESNLLKIVGDRRENLKRITEQRQRFHDEIKHTREKLNKHFDKLEREITENAFYEEKNIKSELENFIQDLLQKVDYVGKLKAAILLSSQSNSNFHTANTEVSANTLQVEQYLKDLSGNKKLQQFDLKFTMDHRILDILTMISHFGVSEVEESEPSLTIFEDEYKQTQVMINPSTMPVSFHDISFTLQRCIQVPQNINTCINACTVMPSGNFIFSDFNEKVLIILNNVGDLYGTVSLQSNPCDVTCVNPTTIAVTSVTPNQICIINVFSKNITRKIETSSGCYGITYSAGLLLFCQKKKGLLKMNLFDFCISEFMSQQSMSTLNFVAINKNKIFITNCHDDSVTCYNSDGKTLWKFRDETFLKCPYGVTVDSCSNVYIASSGNNSIVVFSADGDRAKNILSSEDDVHRPRAVHFEKYKNELLVVNEDGKILLFKLISEQ